MGTPVPEEFPELEDNKWYCLTVQYYHITDPDEGCEGPYDTTDNCCQRGDVIKAWYHDGWECKAGFGVCVPSEAEPQRITACHGPYDTREDCATDCGI